MSELNACRKCESTELDFVKEYENRMKGSIFQVKTYRCKSCNYLNKASNKIGSYDHTPRKKKERKKGISIAKQLDLDQYREMKNKMKPREIKILLCPHFDTDAEKAACNPCYQSLHRMNKRLEKLEVKAQTFADFGAFEEYPIVKEFIEDRKLRRVEFSGHIGKLTRYWEHLERKHPATWDEDDLKEIVKLIRKWGVVPYSFEGSLRAWFKFTDAKNDRGRLLVKHPLLEASRSKQSSGGRKNGERDINYMTPKEFLAVIEATEPLVFKAIMWTHVTLGCREGSKKEASYNRGRGGIMGLNWPDVNWERKTMNVYETKTKGGITWMDCPLDLFGDQCITLLRQYWESRGRPSEGKMFHIRYKEYTKYFKVLVSKVIGRELRPHSNRDTHATWLLNMDVKVELIIGTTSRRKQEGYALGVGWMEPRMFFEHYARIMRQKKDAEVKKAREGFKNYVGSK